MNTHEPNKLLDFDTLVEVISSEKNEGKSIALCHGVFDLVHPGHVRHLNAASQQADILVVTVTADKFVNKGPGRPVYDQVIRGEMLAAFECVDYVSINDANSAVNVITALVPNVYVKGSDYAVEKKDITGKITEERSAVKSVGGRIHFTTEMTMSSSEILNANFDIHRPQVKNWLAQFENKFALEDSLNELNKLADLNVLVIGEAIIDEYHFCEGLGKASKDPIVAFRYCSEEVCLGGSLAVANHLAGICNKVGLISILGEGDNYETFVKDNLDPKIDGQFFYQNYVPTIRKRRYIDNHTGGKLFELYTMEETALDEEVEQNLLNNLSKELPLYDMVVVADYGHGMMTPAVIQKMTSSEVFLALNTQANAGNRGFNTVSRYERADYVCLNGAEVMLEMRVKEGDIKDLVKNLSQEISCKKFTVTLGRSGMVQYDEHHGYFEAPALALNVTDRVGAGDAVLAITSPMVALDMPWEWVGLLGNLAGAEAVAELGNKRILKLGNLIKHAQSILN